MAEFLNLAVKIAFLMLIGQPCATYLPPMFKLHHPDILSSHIRLTHALPAIFVAGFGPPQD